MLIRFIYTSIVVGIVENVLLDAALINSSYYTSLITIYSEMSIVFLLILESSLRFPMIFSFVRVTQKSVSKYINDFINDMNTPYLDREHFVVKVQAGKLFQIAGWGTICVSFLTSFVLILQYSLLIIGIVLGTTLDIFTTSTYTTLKTIFLPVISIIQVITILPSILYSAFLIILWLYFRYKTKVKYSGYSSNDPIVSKLIHEPETDVFSNQDKFHFTYYKHKNRVMMTTYVVCVVLVSVMFAVFFAPVLSEKWKWNISLKPGDYYLLENSVLKDGCPDDRFTFTVSQSYLTIFLPNQIDLNCSENILAGILLPNETSYTTYKYPYPYYPLVWIPENSTVTLNVTDAIGFQSQHPCYYRNGIYIYTNTLFEDTLALDSCIGVELNQYLDIRNITKCNDTTNRGQLQCKMLITGMYYNLQGNITVEQFGYTILEPTLTPLNKVRGEQLSKYDVILFKSSENIPDTSSNVCSIHASCLFNPFFRILMPVAILLCSMIVLTIVLFLIHKV